MKEMKDFQISFLGKHIPSFHSICLSIPRDFKLVCSAREGERLRDESSGRGIGVQSITSRPGSDLAVILSPYVKMDHLYPPPS